MALTPAAQQLHDRIAGILAKAKGKHNGGGFIAPELQDALCAMSTADMLALEPPSTESGVWTNDAGFCLRLGCHLFGASPESVHELPWQYYLLFTQIVTANFLRSMEGAIPS